MGYKNSFKKWETFVGGEGNAPPPSHLSIRLYSQGKFSTYITCNNITTKDSGNNGEDKWMPGKGSIAVNILGRILDLGEFIKNCRLLISVLRNQAYLSTWLLYWSTLSL